MFSISGVNATGKFPVYPAAGFRKWPVVPRRIAKRCSQGHSGSHRSPVSSLGHATQRCWFQAARHSRLRSACRREGDRPARPAATVGDRRTAASHALKRVSLPNGHLHQWAIGHNCRSQSVATMPAEQHQCHRFLPAAKLSTVWGANNQPISSATKSQVTTTHKLNSKS